MTTTEQIIREIDERIEADKEEIRKLEAAKHELTKRPPGRPAKAVK